MLSGDVKPGLAQFCPQTISVDSSRTNAGGLQIKPTSVVTSLNLYKRSFYGRLPEIWSKIPQSIVLLGAKVGWIKIQSRVCKVLLGKLNFEPQVAHSAHISKLNPYALPYIPVCRPARTSLLCPNRVKYSAAAYTYRPVVDTSFCPGITAGGYPCKRCLKLRRRCFQHLVVD